MTDLIEIVVDDLPVEVDREEYQNHPERVTAQVRANRAEVVGELSQKPAMGYDEYTKIYGQGK